MTISQSETLISSNNTDLSHQAEKKQLDFLCYQKACSVLSQTNSTQEFETGYAQGQFHFSDQPELILQLIQEHKINLHFLSGEWLALCQGKAKYGQTPNEAVIQVFLAL